MTNIRLSHVYQSSLLLVLVIVTGCGITDTLPTLEPLPTHQLGTTTELTYSPSPTPTQTLKPTLFPTETLVPLPAHTLTPTLPPTPLPNTSFYNSLPPGQYVVYDSGPISVISLDGVFQSPLIVGRETWTGAITTDGKLFAFLEDNYGAENPELYVYDLVENTIVSIPTGKACYEVAWSPDGTTLAAQCRDPFGEIYVISLIDGMLNPLSVQSADDASAEGKPAWSPDGKWIAFQLWFFKDDSRTGIYITNTACLSEMYTCESYTEGPFLSGADYSWGPYLAWSPDSQYLAVENGREDTIDIIEVSSGEIRTLAKSKSLGYLFGLAWSHDGEWLAYGSPSNDPIFWGIYLLSPWGGEPILLTQEGGDVEAWITIPHLFEPGDIYTITEAGADLNLRTEPSLDSAVLTQLQPGDAVTILDGPVEADGYTWWKMSTEDGTEGWAVNIPEWYEPLTH